MHASAIFQRTESGRSEIKNKMHGLTQSERLALIVVDGVSTYGDLRRKLKGLSDERFERALIKLLQKNLVFEVLLPMDGAVAEEFDTKTVNQFLHQDPLDPVTIMSIDPEEEFDLDMPAEIASMPHFQSEPVQAVAGKLNSETTQVKRPINGAPNKATQILHGKKALKIASVDFYVPLENSNQIMAYQQLVPEEKTNGAGSLLAAGSEVNKDASSVVFSNSSASNFAWAPILLIGGIIIIIVSLVLTYRH